jgi:hypothetical protein
VDVRIGIIQAPRELDIELPAEVTQEQVLEKVEKAFTATDGIVWLTDKRGRQIGIPCGRVAYVEIGAQDDIRKVGFGAS